MTPLNIFIITTIAVTLTAIIGALLIPHWCSMLIWMLL